MCFMKKGATEREADRKMRRQKNRGQKNIARTRANLLSYAVVQFSVFHPAVFILLLEGANPEQ